MNGKVKVLLGVFLLLLAVVAGVRWWPKPQAPELRLSGWGPGLRTEKADEVAPIDRIEIAIGQDTGVLERGAEGWRLTPPEGATADRAKVRQILDGFRENLVSVLGSPTAGSEATFGLDPDHRIRVTLRQGESIAIDLEVGAVRKPESGTGPGDTFVRVPGTDRAWRIPDRDLRRPLQDGIPGLRDRRILPFAADRVTAITVSHPDAANPLDRRIVLESTSAQTDAAEPPSETPKARQWRIVSPQGQAAGDVHRLTSALDTLRAQEWANTLPDGVDLGPDAFGIEATLDDGTRWTLHVSTPGDGGAWLRADDVPGYARIPKHTAQALRLRLGDLRDKQVFGLTPDRIASIALDDGPRRWHFTRKGNDFESLSPLDLPLGRAQIEALFGDVARLRAESWMPRDEAREAGAMPSDPAAQLTVWATDGSRQVLHLGNPGDGGKVWAWRDDDPDTATIASWILERIRQDAESFRNRVVFPFAAPDISRIRIEHPDEVVTLVAGQGNDGDTTGFTLDGEATPPKPEAVLSLVSTLAGLSARSFPLNAPRLSGRADLRLVVTLRDGSGHELRIAGKDADGNPYGIAPSAAGFRPTVFTLSPHQVDQMRIRKADLIP